jgi:hypothetical protein
LWTSNIKKKAIYILFNRGCTIIHFVYSKYFQIFSIWTHYPAADVICCEKIDNSIYIIYFRKAYIEIKILFLLQTKICRGNVVYNHCGRLMVGFKIRKDTNYPSVRLSVYSSVPLFCCFSTKKQNTKVSNLKLRKVWRKELL